MALKPLKTLNFGGEDTYYLDFKNVENTPFETVGGDTLVWDGNTEGLYGVDMIGDGYNTHYLITEVAPTMDDLANGLILTASDGSAIELSAENVTHEDAIIMIGGLTIIIFSADLESDDGIIKKGIYFPDDNIAQIRALTINGYTGFPSTKLKEECVPMDYITEKVLSALPTWSGGEY